MFTGVVDDAGANAAKEMGGLLVQSVADCTHLVTDKVRRTIKFLCCLAQGCQIVSTKWLDESRAHGGFVSADGYLLRDRVAERQHNFSLGKSIMAARTSPLLAGWKVHMTDNIKPSPIQSSTVLLSQSPIQSLTVLLMLDMLGFRKHVGHSQLKSVQFPVEILN